MRLGFPRDESPYEVRCYACDTSFAPGTRTCIHCGQRLGRGPEIELVLGAPEGEEGEREVPSVLRNLLWGLSVLLALAFSMLRACSGAPG